MSVFNYRLNLCLLFILSIQQLAESKGMSRDPILKSIGYNICYNEDEQSEQWATYLYNHLSRRANLSMVVLQKKRNSTFKRILIHVDKTLTCDYSIRNTEKMLELRVKDKQTILFFIYQFMKELSNEDDRVLGNDLPPAYLSFTTGMKNFDFHYREPYFSSNLDEDYASIIGTNVVDRDWGIWGHNLGAVLKVASDPYCFSSDSTFNKIKRYVLANYGSGVSHPSRFMIMPNDNDKVCTCPQCVLLGNTKDNASPALAYLINRLAKEFPRHYFFTTVYRSVGTPIKSKWRTNTGVMLSTINLPKGVALTDQPELKVFLDQLNLWKNCTPNIYIWDYAANFDDYLTPIPVLYGLQEQLKFYKSVGIKGVFLNASGYDYSPFEDLKTTVCAALMTNVNVSIDSLCSAYLLQFYPNSGTLLCNYYLDLEHRMQARGKSYDMYGSFQNSLNTYLDQAAFIQFYEDLGQLVSTMHDAHDAHEREALNKLYTALSYTRLQIAYAHKKVHQVKPIIQTLTQYKQFAHLSQYKEANGSLASYLNNWNYLCNEGSSNNLLTKSSLRILSKVDEGYEKSTLLHDGVSGFYGNYHQGWYLSSRGNLHVRFSSKGLQQATNFEMRFLVDQPHYIFPPQKIIIYKNDSVYEQSTSINLDKRSQFQVATCSIAIDLSNCDSVDVVVFRKAYARNTLACDEIRIN